LRSYLSEAEAEAEQNRNVQVQGSDRQHMNYRYRMKDDKLMIHVILNIKKVFAKMNSKKYIYYFNIFLNKNTIKYISHSEQV